MVSKERQEILDRIVQLEKEGNFDTDLEKDPESKQLLPDDIDYLRKKWRNKITRFFVCRGAEKAINQLIDNHQIIIKEVKGAENLKEVKGSAFITSNHFHMFENIAIYKVFQQYANKHTFYRIIREGNYTAPPKGFDMFFKHCNTLPLSSHPGTMKKFLQAISVLVKKNNYILIYPEQYMWWNYKKPRPFKDGAFRFACTHNRPIIPCFITMEDSKEFYDGDGLPVQEYTIHIGKALYKDETLPLKQAITKIKNENFEFCKNIYESTYNTKLVYSCDGEKDD